MKKTIGITAVLILLCSSLFSQEYDSTKKNSEFQTLFGNEKHNGAYGAFTIGYSEIDDKQAVIFGGRFEWIISHSIGFGFGGNGFINEFHYEPLLNSDVFLTGGYGGSILNQLLCQIFLYILLSRFYSEPEEFLMQQMTGIIIIII